MKKNKRKNKVNLDKMIQAIEENFKDYLPWIMCVFMRYRKN